MNKNLNPTAADIFGANNVLTLEKAKQLIGKKLAITNPEYSANKPSVRVFTLLDIKSQWDLAEGKSFENGDNIQLYWSNLPGGDIRFKNRLMLVGDIENVWASCLLDSRVYTEETFVGSDEDREIYYIVLNEDSVN
jgi:hypothetical protein